jgi:hypothetical protein
MSPYLALIGTVLRVIAMLWFEHHHPETAKKLRRVQTTFRAVRR